MRSLKTDEYMTMEVSFEELKNCPFIFSKHQKLPCEKIVYSAMLAAGSWMELQQALKSHGRRRISNSLVAVPSSVVDL